jgi:GTP-binding protein EngB required for normal cell division
MESSESGLNPLHKQHLLTTFQYVDKLLSDIESVLTSSDSIAPFPTNIDDVQPVQRKLISDYIARIRAQILRAMDSQSMEIPGPRFSALHVIRTTLTFIDIAIEEMRPKYLRGYGEVPPAAAAQMEGLVEELESLIERFQTSIRATEREDIDGRMRALGDRGVDTELLQLLNRVIAERGLVEFRARLNAIISRLEDRRFEIALFGRVSSGKSSLLNALLAESVLPVGVTPITAVPTRITYGTAAAVQVWFAANRSVQCGVESLPEFVAEQQNPGNNKHVTRVLVTLPSERLREGVVFVDTPGLGSLATSGAAETIAYLPQCDLGVVLVDAGATLTEEDLATLRLLYSAGIESHILVSKADLLSESDCGRLTEYIRDHVDSGLGLTPPISAVSSKDSHRPLLERWFTQEILPLYEQHAERTRASLWKKILLLKHTVEATLRVKSERLAQKHAPADVKDMERTLRSSAAEIVKCRKECEDWTRDFPDVVDRLLSDIARDMAMTLKDQTGDRDVAHPAEIAVADAVGEMQRRIEMLIDTLVAALDEVAPVLQLTPPTREEFASFMRNMPRFDPPKGQLRLSPSLELLGSRFAEMRIRGNLHKKFGKLLSDALFPIPANWKPGPEAFSAISNINSRRMRISIARSSARWDLNRRFLQTIWTSSSRISQCSKDGSCNP